jgi:hypothetical protein
MQNRYSIVLFLFFISGIGISTYGQKYKEMAKHSTEVRLEGIYGSKKQVFEKNTKIFLDGINKAYLTNTRPNFPASVATSNVNIRIGDLWASSSFLSARPNIIENLLSTSLGDYEVRNLQIIFEEAQKGYEQQDGVLLFDRTGKIIDFKIALGTNSTNTICRDTISVTDLRRRQMIINFVEDFRTSYQLKDIDFLEKVFSDKALIITGKVLESTSQGELKTMVEYKRQTKVEYLTNLKDIFARAKMININFDTIRVVRHPKITDIYGVNLKQTWNSESLKGGRYRDVGYVFLVIDFAVEEKPKIWVRTWSTKDLFSLDVINFQ